MTGCGVTGTDAVDIHRNNLRPGIIRQDAQNGMQRTHPPQAATAPTHGFGPWEVANGGFQHFGNDLGGRTARFLDGGEINSALGGLTLFQLVAGQARAPQETFDRLVRRADLGSVRADPRRELRALGTALRGGAHGTQL